MGLNTDTSNIERNLAVGNILLRLDIAIGHCLTCGHSDSAERMPPPANLRCKYHTNPPRNRMRLHDVECNCVQIIKLHVQSKTTFYVSNNKEYIHL